MEYQRQAIQFYNNQYFQSRLFFYVRRISSLRHRYLKKAKFLRQILRFKVQYAVDCIIKNTGFTHGPDSCMCTLQICHLG